MNILLINHYAGSVRHGMEYRPYYLAREWARRGHPFIMLLQAAENYACRHADAVVSILPKVGAHLEAHGMDAGKLHLIPNGVDPDEWGDDGAALAPGLDAALDR